MMGFLGGIGKDDLLRLILGEGGIQISFPFGVGNVIMGSDGVGMWCEVLDGTGGGVDLAERKVSLAFEDLSPRNRRLKGVDGTLVLSMESFGIAWLL
jgi:hypothetical protein